MIIFDASYLIAYLHPNPEVPKDRDDKPVLDFRERVNHLVATLNASEQIIGVPTPALAEILVRAGKGKLKYLQTIGDAYRFQPLSFDQRAAIDAGELIAVIKGEHQSQPLATWAKVKFDIQIAAIGKASAATIIYSDDKDIEAHGKRLNIPVKRFCDLPSAPVPVAPRIPVETAKGQTLLFDPIPFPQSQETKNESDLEGPEPPVSIPQQEPTIPERRKSDEAAIGDSQENHKLETDSPHPAPVRGGDSGRVEGESAGEVKVDTKQKEPEKPKAASNGGLGGDGS